MTSAVTSIPATKPFIADCCSGHISYQTRNCTIEVGALLCLFYRKGRKLSTRAAPFRSCGHSEESGTSVVWIQSLCSSLRAAKLPFPTSAIEIVFLHCRCVISCKSFSLCFTFIICKMGLLLFAFGCGRV